MVLKKKLATVVLVIRKRKTLYANAERLSFNVNRWLISLICNRQYAIGKDELQYLSIANCPLLIDYATTSAGC
jgi:hypothetical protein